MQLTKAAFLKAASGGQYIDVGGPKASAANEEQVAMQSTLNVLRNDYGLPFTSADPSCKAELEASVRETLRVSTERVTGKNFRQRDYDLAKSKLLKPGGWCDGAYVYKTALLNLMDSYEIATQSYLSAQ